MSRLPKSVLAMALLAGCAILPSAAAVPAPYDVIIRGGTIYDGSGGDPFVADDSGRASTKSDVTSPRALEKTS